MARQNTFTLTLDGLDEFEERVLGPLTALADRLDALVAAARLERRLEQEAAKQRHESECGHNVYSTARVEVCAHCSWAGLVDEGGLRADQVERLQAVLKGNQ